MGEVQFGAADILLDTFFQHTLIWIKLCLSKILCVSRAMRSCGSDSEFCKDRITR
jgi:hypothetical protein